MLGLQRFPSHPMRHPSILASVFALTCLPFGGGLAADGAGTAAEKSPVILITGEENLGKEYLNLPAERIVAASNGDADGLLRAVPWRTIDKTGTSAPKVRFSFGAEFGRGSRWLHGDGWLCAAEILRAQ